MCNGRTARFRPRSSTARAVHPPAPARFHEPWAAYYVQEYAAYAYYCKTAPNETRTWDPPPLPERGNKYEWVQSAQKCMYVHDRTRRCFSTLPPVLPTHWLAVSYEVDALDFVCEHTLVDCLQWASQIPAMPEGWSSAWCDSEEVFLFYNVADPSTCYYRLDMPYLLACNFFQKKD